ncbi:MAG: hypothetical protein KIG13_00230 [Eubacteriales bacterium]|nr:hypothetical protein [Eubacteriales bacterium]
MKNKFKSYGFWVSLSSAVVVLMDAIGRACGFIPDGELINNIIMSIAGLLVVLGVVAMPSGTNKTNGGLENETKVISEKIEETEKEIKDAIDETIAETKDEEDEKKDE